MSTSASLSQDLSEEPASRQPVNIYDPEGEWEDEDDDDDMEYEPSTDRSEDIEFFDPEEEGSSEFMDASEDLSGVEIEFTMENENSEIQNDDGEQTETEQTPEQNGTHDARPTRVTSAHIIQMLGANGLRRILQSHGFIGGRLARDEDDDDEVEEGYGGLGVRRRRRKSKAYENKFPEVPSETGRTLMNSGIYGSRDQFVDDRKRRKTNTATRLMWRELGVDTRGTQLRANQLLAQDMIPSSSADKIIHYDSRCYSGQFSDDGNFFFSCAQDFKVRMYDTSNPFEWKYYKTVDYPFGQWTITDASLSPDNKYLAYSSIRHKVGLAPTDPADHSDPMLLDFTNMKRDASQHGFHGSSHFGIWSIRFSGDGREIVAGTSDRSVVVYDLETRQSILQLQNHEDDVNAVCFGDISSPHILYSGSDDTTLRVWDRRSMGDGREAGVFMGHTEGLTYVDSKGDGRYVLSNGKDQMMKLWDLRKMMTTARFDRIDPNKYSTGFDYRFMSYAEEDYLPHPHDCSVVTFRGHHVLKTLIRCHFSPPGSTNSRYVYSGSEDGSVWIYNLDATVKAKIDVAKATKESRPRQHEMYTASYEMGRGGRSAWKTCVRDASWHPNAPVLAATSWNGYGMATGTCTLHTWNGASPSSPSDSSSADWDDEADPPMGTGYNSRLEYVEAFNSHQRGYRPSQGGHGIGRHSLRSRIVRPSRWGGGGNDDEDGDEFW